MEGIAEWILAIKEWGDRTYNKMVEMDGTLQFLLLLLSLVIVALVKTYFYNMDLNK